ncbi:MAG: hypothetical protein M3Y91_19010 [Actinomycetota bacterium]|nr:hypothetical protein [Actinomycetota bacterium]
MPAAPGTNFFSLPPQTGDALGVPSLNLGDQLALGLISVASLAARGSLTFTGGDNATTSAPVLTGGIA